MSAMEAGQLSQQMISAPQLAPQVQSEPPPDWSDWILFAIGWICGVAWIVGALRPLCCQPRFPATRNKAGWIANVIGDPQSTTLAAQHWARRNVCDMLLYKYNDYHSRFLDLLHAWQVSLCPYQVCIILILAAIGFIVCALLSADTLASSMLSPYMISCSDCIVSP